MRARIGLLRCKAKPRHVRVAEGHPLSTPDARRLGLGRQAVRAAGQRGLCAPCARGGQAITRRTRRSRPQVMAAVPTRRSEEVAVAVQPSTHNGQPIGWSERAETRRRVL